MFLTIGEKIRQVRKQYGLKQVAFESFGFSRNYISMLETNKRSLNEEMKQLMYDALDQLTNGLFKENYTYEQFCLTPEQQAEIWLEEHCTLEYGLSDYEIFNEVATKYELFQPLINLNEKIAIHYYTTRDHQRSNEYFLKAISYCNQTDINPAKYYNLVGVNFNQLGQYKDAIAQYKIASYFLSEGTGSLKYKNLYDMSTSYLYDGDCEQSLIYIDEIMNQNEDIMAKGSSYLLKGMILQKQNKDEEAKKILLEFIENPFCPPILGHAYHNLAYLEYNNGFYEEAKSIFNEIKRDIFTSAHMDQKEDFITWGLQMYLDLKDFDSIKSLFKEVKELIKQALAIPSTLLLMEKQLYKTIINESLIKPDKVLQYTSLIKSL
ncbi:helix-turn-helix transcriptional regulator [Turicibacter sanguinis]|uniref:helix-turn-helix transcriptional regulator n=1 Tax=Turicibacter sanguinis TaxID=154288 RepID=UPI00189A897B|nr:helix-turn-helix transcriptional regulator [Turicibacter sanguinis]